MRFATLPLATRPSGPFSTIRTAIGMLLLGVTAFGNPTLAAEIDWATDFEAALQEAQAEKKFVMVDFYTGWCHWCKVLDRDTYSDQSVISFASENLVSVKVDAERRPDLAKKYSVRGYPTIAFLHPDGTKKKVLPGFKPPEVFLPAMEKVTNTKAQQYTLANRIAGDRQNIDLRRIYANVLALSGDFAGALVHCDTLMALSGDGPLQAGLELDLLLYRYQVEQSGGFQSWQEWGSDLKDWRQRHPEHGRMPEAKILLARGAEAAGQKREARNEYQRVQDAHPGTWYAEFAESRLNTLGS